MKLRGVEFGNVFNSSGARGFHGEGYWFHRLWRPLGLDYTGSTLVTKTTTLGPRPGNMLLDERAQPVDLVPSCIIVKLRAGVVLNAVGLSGPGLNVLGQRWMGSYVADKPLVISIMSVAQDAITRLVETKSMLGLLARIVAIVRINVAIQINFSCPNVGLDPAHLIDEVGQTLDRVGVEAPVMIKLNALVPPAVAAEMSKHSKCDAVVVSNTIPWGQLPQYIEWEKLFGSDISPLAKLGGGGLSGKPLLPIVYDWIKEARSTGLTKPIVGGGGILSRQDAGTLLDAGASAIELGSVSILRPWRVQGIIRYVNARLGEGGRDG